MSDKLFTISQPIVLASGSPRRKEMLEQAGIPFEQIISQCDESVHPGEAPDAMVRRLSRDKAVSVATSCPFRWVLGADTTVVVDGEILGKPNDEKDALRMLSLIQGRTHTVCGGFTLVNLSRDIIHTEVHESLVEIAPLTDAEIWRYISTGEPLDKAGAYAIQGIGSGIVVSVSGSYTNVVGLNLAAVLQALKANGV